MSFEFEDQYGVLMNQSLRKKRGPVLSFVMRLGLAKTEAGANRILVAISIIFLLAAVAIFGWYARVALAPSHATYNFSYDLVQRLPQNVKLKVLSQ